MKDLLRAVLDTNVILASQRTAHPTSPNREITDRWLAGEFTLLVSDDIAVEYAEKLHACDMIRNWIHHEAPEEHEGQCIKCGQRRRSHPSNGQRKPRMPDYFFESLPFMLFMLFVVNSGMWA